MPGSDDLYAACVALLVNAANALATTAAGAPGRVYVSPGFPAFDCPEQLTVHWTPINPSQTPNPSGNLAAFHRNRVWLNLVQFTIVATRCAPVPSESGQPPSTTDLNTAAKEVADDAWALNEYLHARVTDDTLFGTYPCRELQIGPLNQIDPAGGVVGCQVSFIVALDGYAA